MVLLCMAQRIRSWFDRFLCLERLMCVICAIVSKYGIFAGIDLLQSASIMLAKVV